MSQVANPWADMVAAEASEAERMGFIRKTYAHLTGAILAFVALEAVMLSLGVGNLLIGVVANLPMGWLIFLGGFTAL